MKYETFSPLAKVWVDMLQSNLKKRKMGNNIAAHGFCKWLFNFNYSNNMINTPR